MKCALCGSIESNVKLTTVVIEAGVVRVPVCPVDEVILEDASMITLIEKVTV